MRDVRVVEDGATEGPREPVYQKPSWNWLAAGLVIGLGLAVLVFAGGADVAVETEDAGGLGIAEPIADSDATPTTHAEAVGVGEVVEGFPDTLVAVSMTGDAELSYLRWPVAGPPVTDELLAPFTSSVRFDASGRLLAFGVPTPDSGMTLGFGTRRRIIPESSFVTGYAWHDFEPGELAYTESVDGETWLWVVDASRSPNIVARGPAVEGRVVAWGDWGFALQDETMLTLLTSGGEFKAAIEGRALGSTPQGWVATVGDGLSLVSAGGGVKRLGVDLDPIGEPSQARFSPDGTKLVVAGDDGHLIIPLDDSGETTYVPVSSGFPSLAWSSDSRFVVAPWNRGVVIIDTEREVAPVVALTQHSIVAVAAVPITER